MHVRNARRWVTPGPRAWLMAALALFVASAVRIIIHPFVGPTLPGSAFCIAAALVEYYFGLAPALTVMLLGLGIADYLFVPPYAQIDVFNRADLTLLISYPVVTLIVICLIERLRRAQFRAELIASVAQSRYEMLLRADNERALQRRAADETHRLLRHLAHYHDAIVLIQALDRNGAQRAAGAEGAANAAGVAGAASGALRFAPSENAPGSRYAAVHPDDLPRLSHTLHPGGHRLRLDHGAQHYKVAECICERFTTHAGDFQVLRIDE